MHLQFVCHFHQMMAMKLIKINDDVIENTSRINVLRQMQTNDDGALQWLADNCQRYCHGKNIEKMRVQDKICYFVH